MNIFNWFKVQKEIEESYLERSKRIKLIVEGDEEILKKATETFKAVYLGKGRIDESYLGSGDHQIVHNIGKIYDPLNKREIYLATKLVQKDSVFFDSEGFLLDNFQEFQEAFYGKRVSPPYFCSFVTWKNPNNSKLISGLMVEDVSEDKKFKLKEISKRGNFERSDYKIFHLDPLTMGLDAGLREDLRTYLNYEKS